MIGQARFFQVRSGRSYFAKAWVEVEPNGNGIDVISALPETVDSANGEVNERMEPQWVAAAREGIRFVLKNASQRFSTGKLTRLVGTVTDSREDTVWCAAALATANALGIPESAFEVAFHDEQWTFRFRQAPLSSSPNAAAATESSPKPTNALPSIDAGIPGPLSRKDYYD